jgi:serine/threonine protein kinase
MPFNSGASAGRNLGVSKIKTKYFVLLDDDYEFTKDTKLETFLNIIENSDLDILGGQVLENDVRNGFFGTFFYNEKHRYVICKQEYTEFKNYKACEIIPQFFIGKTETIKTYTWNEKLKTGEHSVFFFENRSNFKVGFTEEVSVNHKQESNNNYYQYRNKGLDYFSRWMKDNNIAFFKSLDGKTYSDNSLREVDISSVRPNQRRKTFIDEAGQLLFPKVANDWTETHAYGISIARQDVLKSGIILKKLIENPHPNILRIFDYDDNFVWMEYIQGKLLSNRSKFAPKIWKKSKCYLDERRNINFSHIEDAVRFLHSNGIAHTDITSFNIMVDENHNLKLIDLLSAMPLTDELRDLDYRLLRDLKAELIKDFGRNVIK